ncbi:BadF/BadG/BcrA/BcrD ATPase family protein [Rhizobium sp. HT1-10]|uniref:BadF/BadG/BcrA/BcrD ATPase family protein n=1 Tax=Rhizobium sp. HT1-10 TaxID=3111638 RepID=UPI003C1755AA
MTKYAIGIDGGGTSCRAAVADATGTIVGRGVAGAANIMSDPDGALENIVRSSRAAFEDAGLDPSLAEHSAAVLGVAGANVGLHGEKIRTALPFARADVVTDSLIALQGALGHSDGVVGAFGTGSVYGARRNGKVTEIGGWGFVIGDQSSGARLGRDLLEIALLAHDGVETDTPLTRIVMAEFANNPQDVVEFAHAAKPREFARYAPVVFEHATAGDAVATRIVAKAASDIDRSLDALLWPECDTVCLLGGLSGAYRSWLSPAHRALLAEPKGDALQGAVSFAIALAAEDERCCA